MGDGVHGFHGGFEHEARERREELLEEARRWRLARLARPDLGLGGRLASALRRVAGVLGAGRPRGTEDPESAVGGVPDLVYLTSEGSRGAVEVYLGLGGCVVRKTDLRTGKSTDAFVADERVKR